MRRLISAALLALVLVGGVAVSSPVQAASLTALTVTDCGTEPDFWNDPLGWASWNGCNFANGAGTAISDVTNPLFQSISDGVDATRSLVAQVPGKLDDLKNQVFGLPQAIANFFVPQPGDFDPISQAVDDAMLTREPFQTITLIAGRLQEIEGQWQTDSGHGSSSASDFGTVSGGVADWLWFLDYAGMGQSVWMAIFSAFMVITTIASIGADIGVRMGRIDVNDVPRPLSVARTTRGG